jgi:hypothetical protein
MATPESKPELEKRWLVRLKDARARLEAASIHLKDIEEKLQSGLFQPPDGGFAYRAALRSETQALIKYSHMVRAYTDLVVHGKIPDEPTGK